MRILLVTETYPPEINGVAMTTGRMVEGLRGRGHWVGLVRPQQGAKDIASDNEWMVPGVPIPNYAGLRIGMPYWLRLHELMRAQRPDVVHIVTEGPLGWTALVAARGLGLPVSSGYHTHFDQYSEHYGMKWLGPVVTHALDALHRRCQATLVPAPELAETLSARGIPNVNVVGRGVDTTLLNPEKRSEPLRASWGLGAPNDEKPGLVCLYVGRIAPEKNLDTVVRAFNAISARIPEARMVWVGDGPARARLAEQNPTHIFAGPRIGEDLARHYASADLFLFASLSETWGNVLAEAMASGLGVVAYRRAAAAALIEHGVNGLAPEPGDEQAFMTDALTLALAPERRQLFGQQAQLGMGKHAWDTIAARFEGVLDQVTAHH